MILITVLALALVALQVVLRRQAEQEWRAERTELLNRIKPETAVPVPGEPIWPSLPAVRLDDDEAYWAARDRLEGMFDGGR